MAAALLVSLMAAAFLGTALLGRAVDLLGVVPEGHPALHWLVHIWKLPPSPVYVFLFSGIGLAMLAAFIEFERRDAIPALRRAAAVVGRSSLAVFIAQYCVNFTATVLLHPLVSAAWPIWFLGSLVPMFGVALLWQRLDRNRFFTLGLRARRCEEGYEATTCAPTGLGGPR